MDHHNDALVIDHLFCLSFLADRALTIQKESEIMWKY